MHQAHNIAWNSLSSHLIYIKDNGRYTPRRTDLFPRQLPTQGNSLNHFSRTLATTIKEFSDTERAKYPARYDAPVQGQLFSSDILSRYENLPHPSVTSKSQHIENWIKRAGPPETPCYCTSEGDLADVVKILIGENEMGQLLMLAQHPKIPINRLHSLSWGHSFGWDHVKFYALQAYLFFNVVLSQPDLCVGGQYRSMRSYRSVLYNVTSWGDYDAQSFPHREFLGTPQHGEGGEDLLNDMEKLQQYLKKCFELLYRYDMLARECGVDPDWESSIVREVSLLWKTEVDQGEGPNWTCRFA
ncbi:hypothetical protein B0H10DRAFT_1870269 [Mycena sp. CBHHK59/15]|nr:hypothetical protein B0H10DRAFT_1870269 [Mycena sp. CBHHK59/15]